MRSKLDLSQERRDQSFEPSRRLGMSVIGAPLSRVDGYAESYRSSQVFGRVPDADVGLRGHGHEQGAFRPGRQHGHT